MIIKIAQIVIGAAIIILILLQERSAGMSGLFGGGGDTGAYQTRRGFEKIIFWGTIILLAVFVVLALLQIIR